jgi:hypothetical protein
VDETIIDLSQVYAARLAEASDALMDRQVRDIIAYGWHFDFIPGTPPSRVARLRSRLRTALGLARNYFSHLALALRGRECDDGYR